MTKFLKRVQKTVKKDVSTVIIVGHSDEYTSKIIESFNAVFYVDYVKPPPRIRNVIHIQDVGFLNDLQNIDAIFINQGFDHNILQFLTPLSRKSGPVIFLSNDYTISNEYYQLFIRLKYEQITFVDNYQVWKLKRK